MVPNQGLWPEADDLEPVPEPDPTSARRLIELVAGQKKLDGALKFVRDVAERRIGDLDRQLNELQGRNRRTARTLSEARNQWDNISMETFTAWAKLANGKMGTYVQRFANGTADMFDADNLRDSARKAGREIDALAYIVDRVYKLKISDPTTTTWDSIYSHYLMVLSNYSANR